MKDLKTIIFENREAALDHKELAAEDVGRTRSGDYFEHQKAFQELMYWEHRVGTLTMLIREADLEWEYSEWLEAQGKGDEW